MSSNSSFQEFVVCNYCGAADHKVLHHYPSQFYAHHAYETFSWDGRQEVSLTIVKCTSCGMIYQNPRFKSEYLGMLYPDSVPHAIDLEKEVSHHKFGPLVQLIEEYCEYNDKAQPLSLDIGTRYGLLPEVLRRKGYNAHGIEYNKLWPEVAAASGFRNVYNGTIDNLHELMQAKGISRINLVTMTDVIEHLLDPLGDLMKLSGYQQQGDYMVMQTVDIGSLGYKIFGKWWYHIHGQHTYYFDLQSMKMFYDKVGYDIIGVLRVKKPNNLSILPSVWKKYRQHKAQREQLNKATKAGTKIWFAETRPTLFDIFTVVARKR